MFQSRNRESSNFKIDDDVRRVWLDDGYTISKSLYCINHTLAHRLTVYATRRHKLKVYATISVRNGISFNLVIERFVGSRSITENGYWTYSFGCVNILSKSKAAGCYLRDTLFFCLNRGLSRMTRISRIFGEPSCQIYESIGEHPSKTHPTRKTEEGMSKLYTPTCCARNREACRFK